MTSSFAGSTKSPAYRYMRPIKRGRSKLKIFGIASLCLSLSVLMVVGVFSVRGQIGRATRNLSINAEDFFRPVSAQASVGSGSVDAELQAAVERAIADNKAAGWGVTIHDLGSDQLLANVNGDRQMASASLYKLYVVRALAEKVPFAEWQSQHVGGRSIATCVDLMLRISDNLCGETLAEYVGWQIIDDSVQQAGYSRTGIHRVYGFATSSYDTTLFMRDLYLEKMFDAETTKFVLNSLEKQKLRTGIPAGCKDCKTWNKTGDLNEAKHDTAIVASGSRKYAVTIMSEAGSFAKIARVQQAITQVLR